jgi:nucleotide-binding universal stress UspA family protein
MIRVLDTEARPDDPISAGSTVPTTFVVPLDGSDFALRAVPVARRFASKFGIDILAVTTPHSLDRTFRGDVPAWLAALAAEPSPVRVRPLVADVLDPADAVLAQMAAHPGASVCMATHARGTIGSGALGNVAQQILHRASVPVLLVGRHCRVDRLPSGPVVVAHDGSAAADTVLAAARAWGRAADVEIVLVHVREPLDPSAHTRADPLLAAACRRLGPSARLEVVTASFAPGAVREVAQELDASLVALATHGQTGCATVTMGRVASWITRESPCPVLAVRPPGLNG